MARKPRIALAGYAQHVVQRGNNRQATFFAEADYRYYLDCLVEASAKYDCALHAYVLMTNHVHLLVTPPQSPHCPTFDDRVARHDKPPHVAMNINSYTLDIHGIFPI